MKSSTKLIASIVIGALVLLSIISFLIINQNAETAVYNPNSPAPQTTNTPISSPTTASPTPALQPSPTAPASPSNETETISVGVIVIGDNGESGRKIGCEDSVVLTQVPVSERRSTAPETALATLLALNPDEIIQENRYTSLSQSTVSIESLEIENSTATLNLTGQLQIDGACDVPRVTAQLTETLIQFPNISQVEIFINGELLETALSTR